MEIIIIAATLILDQIVKFWAQTTLAIKYAGSLAVIPGVFHFTYIRNTGAAFGILENARWFFVILTPIVTIALAVYLVKHRRKLPKLVNIALALMISGAIGNWLDRVMLGFVRDMFDFCLIHFAVFNVADMCVTISVVILVYYLLFIEGKQDKLTHAKKGAESQKGDI